MFFGIGLKLTSTIAFILMSAQAKFLSNYYPIGQLIFCRAFFAMIPLLIWLGMRGELKNSIFNTYPPSHLKRCIAGSSGMFFGFGALSYLPLPDATAISYLTPLLTTGLAALLLNEHVRSYRWGAVGIGFCGMLLMLSPHLTGLGDDTSPIGAMLGLCGAICSAFASLEVRKLSRAETTGSIVFYFTLTTSIFGALSVFLGWKMPSVGDALFMIGTGIAGGIGQILLTSSYRHADVSVIAPFDYCSLLWALVIGYFLFGETPNPIVLAGAAIVIAAGVTVIYWERQIGLKRAQERASGVHRST
jgi:drug/metabolite transporter (DMT)-like permease